MHGHVASSEAWYHVGPIGGKPRGFRHRCCQSLGMVKEVKREFYEERQVMARNESGKIQLQYIYGIRLVNIYIYVQYMIYIYIYNDIYIYMYIYIIIDIFNTMIILSYQ